MKFRLLTLLLLCCGAAATAQNPYIVPEGATESASGISVNMPRSVVAVDLTVERTAVLCGPYARYAQKYLGVRAPLTDKTTWRIADARIALAGDAVYEAPAPASATSQVLSHASSDEAFAALQPDRTSMTILSLEDAARSAAEQIFALRRHRLELISGEAGEHVFGEGLKSALNEIDRLEQEYLELFLGKQVRTTAGYRYLVYPSADKKQYIFCRFSPAAGLLPENDLSGDMVVLQIEPSGNTSCSVEAGPKESSVVMCRVADPSTCTVIAGGQEYVRAVLPLFEFGRTVRVALPRRK